jgi:hypothetical protein
MLWSVAFSRIGIVVSDIYLVHPEPGPGQEGAERGVRLELRVFERDELPGSTYSSVPIRVGRPLWRVDLLESVASAQGSLDRADFINESAYLDHRAGRQRLPRQPGDVRPACATRRLVIDVPASALMMIARGRDAVYCGAA